jgi:hypothetical protein
MPTVINEVLQFLIVHYTVLGHNMVTPELTSEDQEKIRQTCQYIGTQGDELLQFRFYFLLLSGLYKSDELGARNHFIELRKYFYDFCPDKCQQFECALIRSHQEKANSLSISRGA